MSPQDALTDHGDDPIEAVRLTIVDLIGQVELLREANPDATAQEALRSVSSKLRSAAFEAFQARGAPFLSAAGESIPSRWIRGSWVDGQLELRHPDGRWLAVFEADLQAAYWPDAPPGWLV